MRKTVAVIGGGYGGASVAKALDEHADVVLIEPKDAFVHSAGSLRALVRPDWADNIFFTYDTLLQRGSVVRERAASVDAGGVTLASGRRVEADFVVLATGSGYPYPAKFDTDATAEALVRLRSTHDELARAERVFIAGAGPVGLELAGEIKAVWPDKHVIVVDPGTRLLPGFDEELRQDLHRQLDEVGIELRQGTSLLEEPPTRPGEYKPVTARTTGGDVEADIWFRAYGVDVSSHYLGDGRLTTRNERGQVPVTDHLNVAGHANVYAIGDITDLDEAKMAAFAMRHAEVVAENIRAQLAGGEPSATYAPSPIPSLLLPLGPDKGVGQYPGEDGPAFMPAETVAAYKGADIFIGRFEALFNRA